MRLQYLTLFIITLFCNFLISFDNSDLLAKIKKEEERVIGLSIDAKLLNKSCGEINNKNFKLIDTSKKYTLLVSFSRISCNTCLTKELESAKELYKMELKNIAFRGLAVSDTPFYVRRFIRLYRIKFPFFEDNLQSFAKGLKFSQHLYLLLIDNKKQKIIKAYVPSPTFLQRSNEFKKEILKFIKSDK